MADEGGGGTRGQAFPRVGRFRFRPLSHATFPLWGDLSLCYMFYMSTDAVILRLRNYAVEAKLSVDDPAFVLEYLIQCASERDEMLEAVRSREEDCRSSSLEAPIIGRLRLERDRLLQRVEWLESRVDRLHDSEAVADVLMELLRVARLYDPEFFQNGVSSGSNT